MDLANQPLSFISTPYKVRTSFSKIDGSHLLTPYLSIGTNTYLVGRGAQRLLIDTGEGRPSWSSNLKSLLTAEKATVKKALLTHWHGDHVGGVPDLQKICPDVEVYKHEPDDGQLEIKDGQEFSVEGATLKAFHTPGHTVDHIAFVLKEEDAMFTGDSTSLSFRTPPPPLFFNRTPFNVH